VIASIRIDMASKSSGLRSRRNGVEMEIPANEWPNFGFDLTTLVDDDAPAGVCTWGHRQIRASILPVAR
jgi:hypothetical protein